jgi:FtsP/CotA-like multicopper oxidase with cupredoxin domain
MITLDSPITRAQSRPPRGSYASVRVYSAVLLTLGSALIHLAVAPEHLREWLPFGVFFLAVGSAQIVLAVNLLAKPTRRLALNLAIQNVFLLGIWTISRSVGLPFGPTPGQPEEIALTDVLCGVLEVLALVTLVALVIWPVRRRPRRIWLVCLGTLPAAILSLAMTSIAISATLSAMPEAVNAAPPRPGQPTTSITTLVEAPGNQPVKHFTLTAAETQIDGNTVWALNGSVPGPELRVTQGDRVQVTLVNQLPESTTLHWHGVVLPNAEDGVAGVTQDAVAPGAQYTYEFVANEPGTYWYHSHQQTEEQLPRGLLGALVVLPSSGAVPEQRDYTVLFHGDSGHVSINGASDSVHLEAKPGETVRLRLINAVVPSMDGGPEAPVVLGAPVHVASLDGRDLNAPSDLGPTRIPLGMGQRADVVFTMPSSGSVEVVDTELAGETTAVQQLFTSSAQPHFATLTIGDGQPPAIDDAADAPLFDPLQYGQPTSDAVAAATPDQVVPVVLGEHGGMRDGRPQLIHTINDAASPSVPPITVSEGQIVRLHIVNSTAEYHPMHLHGHVMSVLSVDDQPVQGSPIHQDSILVGPHQTIDVAFAANNPGIWMFHCHVLLHAGMGMTTSVNYVGYSTPFEMGTRSGNMPE